MTDLSFQQGPYDLHLNSTEEEGSLFNVDVWTPKIIIYFTYCDFRVNEADFGKTNCRVSQEKWMSLYQHETNIKHL